MRPALKNHGDDVERRFANFINERIPEYETLWSRYIGNDGTSKLAAPNYMNSKLENARERTAQFSYTALEALLCAELVCRRVESEQIGDAQVADRTERYMSAINDLIAFYAQIGRAVDSFRKLGKIWKDKSLAHPLNDYYQQRNIVLHEAKMPFCFDGEVLSLAKPEGAAPDSARWTGEMFWYQSSALPREAMPDLLRSAIDEVLKLANSAYARLHDQHLAKTFASLPTQIEAILWKEVRATTSASIAISMKYGPD